MLLDWSCYQIDDNSDGIFDIVRMSVSKLYVSAKCYNGRAMSRRTKPLRECLNWSCRCVGLYYEFDRLVFGSCFRLTLQTFAWKIYIKQVNKLHSPGLRVPVFIYIYTLFSAFSCSLVVCFRFECLLCVLLSASWFYFKVVISEFCLKYRTQNVRLDVETRFKDRDMVWQPFYITLACRFDFYNTNNYSYARRW